MAEIVLSSLINNLRQSIISKEDIRALEDEVGRIAEEMEWMMPQLGRIEGLTELTDDVSYLMERITIMIYRAEDLIDTYAKSARQSKMAANYKKPIYWFKLRRMAKKLKTMREKFVDARDRFSFLLSLAEQVVDPLPAHQGVPPHLRRCIYYLLLFPVNFEISPRRLILLWVAEGLVHPKKYGDVSAEHIAERYLNELINIGVVRITAKKGNGKVKACQLKDDATREAWLTRAEEANFLQDRNQGIRRLVDHQGTTDASFIRINGNPVSLRSVQYYREVITFLSFNTQRRRKSGEDIGDFLYKCISAECFLWLNVLDLERVFRPKLPRVLGKLIGLKYLGLRRTDIEFLPAFVDKLLNLQVLDLKHTKISLLPKSIWIMQYLRHLYLNEDSKFGNRSPDASLKDLQTLWGVFIDETTMVKEGLDTLTNIRKLGLSCWWSRSSQSSRIEEQLEAVDQWISRLEFLESLTLKSRDEQGIGSDLHLNSLAQNENLSKVYLLGKLNPRVIPTFPASLTDITLSESMLELDPMEFLERLPHLVSLQLRGLSVVHPRMHCSRGGFPRLQVLRIWKLENLEAWEVERGSLPSLEFLEIRSCGQLKMLPDGLQHVNTLQTFMLNNMPEKFIDSTRKNQPQLWDKIKHVTQVGKEHS